jgi:opacity protein-like surface antigen
MSIALSRPWRRVPEGLRRARTLLGLVPFVLALLIVDATPGAAQWPEVERWFDGSQPVTLGVESSRFRVSGLGSRPAISVEDASPGTPPFRFIDTDLRGSGVALDLKLRWPTVTPGASGFGAVEPYLSFGPMVFAQGSDSSRVGQSGSKSDGAMALGLSMGAGLSWRFAPNAELFGGYRVMQYGRDSVFSRGERSFSDPDVIGHDVLYGISVRF